MRRHKPEESCELLAYTVSEDLFQQVISLVQSEPEQEAFRKSSTREAGQKAARDSE